MSDPTAEDKLAHPCFPQPQDKSIKIWRYIDLPKLIWLLANRKLYLSRVDLLGDPHEGSIPDLNIQARNQLYAQRFPELVRESPRINCESRTQLYVSCWCLGNEESEAMWRLYCPDNKGIAIQSTYQRLIESIAHEPFLHIGCVRYIDYQKDWFPAGNVYYPIMHKRLAFSHEREVRLATQFHSDTQPAGIHVDWDFEKHMEALFIDPYAPGWFREIVIAVTQKFSPSLEQRIHWSGMRAVPLY